MEDFENTSKNKKITIGKWTKLIKEGAPKVSMVLEKNILKSAINSSVSLRIFNRLDFGWRVGIFMV